MNTIDQALFLWINLSDSTPGWVLTLARGVSLNMLQWMVAATIAVGVAGQPQWRAQAWRVLGSIALASAMAYVLKRGFDLPRPFALDLGTQWLEHGASPGFPSSHASAAAGFAVSACLSSTSWWARGALFSSCLLVGWSRIALGLHFPSDVLVGICVGALSALVVQAITTSPPGGGRLLRLSRRDRS